MNDDERAQQNWERLTPKQRAEAIRLAKAMAADRLAAGNPTMQAEVDAWEATQRRTTQHEYTTRAMRKQYRRAGIPDDMIPPVRPAAPAIGRRIASALSFFAFLCLIGLAITAVEALSR